MTYKYYKFPNKDMVPKQWPENVSVSEVGLVKKTNAIYNEKGYVVEPPTYHDGWHINVCYQGEANLENIKEFEIIVDNPKQKWFGQ